MENRIKTHQSAGEGRNGWAYAVIGIALLWVTVYSSATGNEAVFAPMLMFDQVFLAVWLFKPQKTGPDRAAFYAIVGYGLFIGLLSIAFTILVPIYGLQWGWEIHPDDDILYPAVNDGRENCYFTSFLFLIFYLTALYQRFAARKKKILSQRGLKSNP